MIKLKIINFNNKVNVLNQHLRQSSLKPVQRSYSILAQDSDFGQPKHHVGDPCPADANTDERFDCQPSCGTPKDQDRGPNYLIVQ